MLLLLLAKFWVHKFLVKQVTSDLTSSLLSLNFIVETVAQNLLLINDYFKTIYSHFLGSYKNIFHKKEIQTVILRG